MEISLGYSDGRTKDQRFLGAGSENVALNLQLAHRYT